ncbi:hypothetical protein [Mycolicibacterium hodleri]|uniref:Uncharacterized protein n=1 Tax=Mycolicibacterium hodleri TaxID=49897 RepID=A0A502EF87_9MYCO|nr:hypothetical protein [Mycolicibacterium hodleri]TPG35170.1 hypothetical protein EAH80_10460 [Mycolicibacterium hodleri]
MAVADYTFVESGPNSLRYEVRCGRCGEAYCEVHEPVAPNFSSAVEVVAVHLPAVVAPATGGIGDSVRAWLGAARAGLSRIADDVSSRIALMRIVFRR